MSGPTVPFKDLQSQIHSLNKKLCDSAGRIRDLEAGLRDREEVISWLAWNWMKATSRFRHLQVGKPDPYPERDQGDAVGPAGGGL